MFYIGIYTIFVLTNLLFIAIMYKDTDNITVYELRKEWCPMSDSRTNTPETKLNYKKTILTGFGFLATSIAWAIYDPYITKILNKLLTANATVTAWSDYLVEKLPILAKLAEAQGEEVALAGGGFTLVPLFIGIIMTFDNIFGVIFQPAFGKLSDNCHSKLGKRRPFIVGCAPVSALLFFLIPFIANGTNSLPLTMLCIILFVFSMSLWRAPVVALMPDLTPPALRSEGNAVINLMGGLGGAIGMVAGTLAIALCSLFTGATKAQINANEAISFPYVFAIGAIIMIIGMLVLLFFVKEQDSSIKLKGEANAYADAAARKKAEKEAKKAEKAAKKAMTLSKSERKSLVFMLICLFFLFCGTNAITTFFSLFAQEILHKVTADATKLMLIFLVFSALAAIPAGKIGKKIGRKKTIIAGLAVFLVAFMIFFSIFVGMLGAKDLSINEYVSVNNAYIAVNDQINEYNAVLADEAKENGVDLTDDDVLTMDGYISYNNALENGGVAELELAKYEKFDMFIAENTGADVSVLHEGVVKVVEVVLGTQPSSFSEAMQTVSDTVKDITKVLGILIFPVLVLGGAANMFITVNTLPLVLDIGGIEKVGTFTGYYYTATFSAQIASPILYGFIRMFAGTYMSLFYYSPVAFVIALLMIIFVKHGEAVPDEIVEAAAQDD